MKPNICGSGHKLTVAECCDDENFVFLTVNRISDVTKPSRCHAYVLPNNDVFIWSFYTNQMVKISSSSHIGQDGKSAYELALEEGYQGTLNEWLKSLIGRQGDKGDRGLSAYEVALAAGFKGTMEEWLASLKGNQGDKGDPGNDGKDGRDGKDGNEFTAPMVLDTITGTTPTVYNETLEVDGEQATGSIFVKDQSIYENLLLSKNDLSDSVWTVSKHKAPVIVKNGLGKGIDTIIQEYATTDEFAHNYLDIIEQTLFSKNLNIKRILPGKWYTLTFKAKGHTANARVASFIYPRLLDVNSKMILNGVERPVATPADGFLDLALANEWQTFTISFKTRSDLDESTFGGNLLFRLNSSHKGHKVELGDFDISEGKEIRKTPTVAPEDYGIVHGQPNLMNGTSYEWEEFTFSAWDTGGVSTSLSSLGLKVGDKIACRCEIDNSQSSLKAKFKLVFRNDTSAIHEVTPSLIQPGEVGFSQGEYTIPEGTTNIYCAKVGKYDGTTQSTIKVRRNKIIKGTLAVMDEWTPSYYDYETNKGLPNKLKVFDFRKISSVSQIESDWEQPASFVSIEVDVANQGLKCTVTTSGANVNSRIYNSSTNGGNHTVGNRTNTYYLDITMQKDSKICIGPWDQIVNSNMYYTASYTGRHIIKVPLTTNFTALKMSIGFLTANVPYIIHRVKWIEGTNTPVNDWSLDTSNYDLNNYMVPFTKDQYAALADPLKCVRAETNVVGEGAEIKFEIKLIEELERRYPYLFVGMTLTEKINKYLSALKGFKIVTTHRGGGIHYKDGTKGYFSRIHIKPPHIPGTWGFAYQNQNPDFITQQAPSEKGNMDLIHSTGNYIFYVVSRKKGNVDTGAISDGITPAWVEVRDFKMVVELEINGKTVVEEIAAEAAKNPIAEFVGNGIVHKTKMDFKNKTSGSLTVNPNIVARTTGGTAGSTVLLNPNQFPVEVDSNWYKTIAQLDGKISPLSSLTDKGIAQQRFSWNIVEDLKRKGIFEAYGVTELSAQVALAKKLITSCKYSVWGFASSPAGYKMSTAYWLDDTAYSVQRPFNATNEIREVTYSLDKANAERTISSNGFVHVIAYTEPNSSTVFSELNIDCTCLEYTINLNLADIIDARLAKQKGLTFNEKFPLNKGDGHLVVKQKNGIVELQLVLMNAVYPANEKIYDNRDIDEVLSKIFKTFRLERMNVNNLLTNEVVELESLIQFAPSLISFVSSEVDFTEKLGMLTFTLVPENEL